MILTPENVMTEVKASLENARKHRTDYEKKVRRFHGPSFRSDSKQVEPLNYDYEYISLMLGKSIASNPRAKITIFGDKDERDQGVSLQDGLNRWIRSQAQGYRSHLQQLATDFYLMYGVSTVSVEIMPGFENEDEPLYWPKVKRIRSDDFFWDHRAQWWGDGLYLGNRNRAPKDDFLRFVKNDRTDEADDYPWDIAAIEAMSEDVVSYNVREYDTSIGGPPRREIEWFTVWFRNEQPELDDDDDPDDYHGVILTLAGVTDDAVLPQFIRPPMPFFGAPHGPYNFFGCHFVPTDAAPLGPLTAVEGQIQEANAQARALDENKANWKKIVAFESLGKNDTDSIKNARHGEAISVANIDKAKFVELEMGGPSQIQFEMEQHSEVRVAKVLGMYDAEQGNTTGEATATENALADAASSNRSSFQTQKFQDGVTMELSAVCFYLYRHERIMFRLGNGSLFFGGSDIERSIELARKNGLLPTKTPSGKPVPDMQTILDQMAVAGGGQKLTPEQHDAALEKINHRVRWSQIDLQIEEYSMERTSELTQQRRLMQGWNLLPQLVQMLVMTPALTKAAPRLLSMFGESLNWPDFGSMIDVPLLAKQQQMNMMQQAAQIQAAQAQQQAAQQQSQPAGNNQGFGLSPAGSGGLPGNFTGAELAASSRG